MFRAGLAATPFPDELPGQAIKEPSRWPSRVTNSPSLPGLFWIQHLGIPPHLIHIKLKPKQATNINLKLSGKKTKKQSLCGKDLNQYFTKDNIPMTNKLNEKILKIINHWRNQIKHAMRYHYIPNSRTKISISWNKTCTSTETCI